MKAKNYRRAGALMVIALAAIWLFPSCDGGHGVFQPERTWVAIDPIQCLGNPWERDWLERHSNLQQPYPLDPAAQETIIRDYYARFGVDVDDILSIPKYQAVCEACSCPRGDALYLSVRDSDVGTMLRLGFRYESPYPWRFPVDTALLGRYMYTGYDSSGTVPLIRGTLTFLKQDTTYVSGTWYLTGPEGYGPQIGEGTFSGSIQGNEIVLNLNPRWVDNNVMLRGELKSGVYAGRWDVITIAGIVYTGNFTAFKHPR